VDGVLGARTRSAIEGFNQDRGVSGIGDETNEALPRLKAALVLAAKQAAVSYPTTIELAERIKRQVQPCWALPDGIPSHLRYRFEYELKIEQILDAYYVDTYSGRVVGWHRLKTQPIFDRVSEAASRAFNSFCGAFEISKEEYQNLPKDEFGRKLSIWFDTATAKKLKENIVCRKRSNLEIAESPSNCDIVDGLIGDNGLTRRCVFDLGGPRKAISILDHVDLNDDGIKEVTVQGNSNCACSARRCDAWVLGLVGDRFRIIGALGPVDSVEVSTRRTNGYLNLVVWRPWRDEFFREEWTFSGGEYRAE
jgi:hypothetical protein